MAALVSVGLIASPAAAMSNRPKPRPKHKNSAEAPQPSLKLTLPSLRRVITTPLEDASLQPETDSVTALNTVFPELADAPVVSTTPASVAVDHAPQEPEDDIEITPRPSTPLAASKTTAGLQCGDGYDATRFFCVGGYRKRKAWYGSTFNVQEPIARGLRCHLSQSVPQDWKVAALLLILVLEQMTPSRKR